jgi:hypothetical protein
LNQDIAELHALDRTGEGTALSNASGGEANRAELVQAGIDEVAALDPVLADLVARVRPIRQRPHDPDGPFAAVVRTIVYQFAGRAAQVIYARVLRTGFADLASEVTSYGGSAARLPAGSPSVSAPKTHDSEASRTGSPSTRQVCSERYGSCG